MATLHVQDIPDKLYERICSLASEQNRSLSEQVIMMLEQVPQQKKSRAGVAELLEQIRRDREAYPMRKGVPDSVTFLREDRAR